MRSNPAVDHFRHPLNFNFKFAWKGLKLMLLNIDKPLRTSTLHTESCSHIPTPYGTLLKPLEQLGRDGGWFSTSSESEAKGIAEREFPRGEFKRCQKCR